MNTFFKLVLIIFLFVSISCDKEKRLETKLSGSLELRQSVDGFTTGGSPNYPPGNGNIIVFKDKNFQKFYSGKLHAEGTFSIGREKIGNKKGKFKIDYFSTKAMMNKVFELDNNTLILYPPWNIADAAVETYVRIDRINNY